MIKNYLNNYFNILTLKYLLCNIKNISVILKILKH